MSPDTTTTALEACGIVLGFWRRDIRDSWELYVKTTRSGVNRRRIVARRIARLRAAIRDLEAKPFPDWMDDPRNAAMAHAVANGWEGYFAPADAADGGHSER